MKKMELVAICALLVSNAFSKPYDEFEKSEQDSIVENLAHAVVSSNVVLCICEWRLDEVGRRSESIRLPGLIESAMEFSPLRFIESISGGMGLSTGELFYLYTPKNGIFILREGVIEKKVYSPSFISTDSSYLMFLQKIEKPIIRDRGLIPDPSTQRIRDIYAVVSDGLAMDSDEFMRKYDLKEFFDSKVYGVVSNCAFWVDVPLRELPITRSMEMNWQAFSGLKQSVEIHKETIYSKNTLNLSSEEVDDLAMIARFFGRVGDAGNEQLLKQLDGVVVKANLAKLVLEHIKETLRNDGRPPEQAREEAPPFDVNELSMQYPGGRISCDHTNYNFGTMVAQDEIHHEFILRNTGRDPVHIRPIICCGDEVVEVHPSVVPPGSNAVCKAVFNTRGRFGSQDYDITLETSDPEHLGYQLQITGTLLQQLAVSPLAIDLGKVSPDLAIVKYITATNLLDSTVVLESISTSSKGLDAMIVESKDRYWKIEVKNNPTLTNWEIDEEVTLHFSSGAIMSVPVRGMRRRELIEIQTPGYR